MNLFKAFNWKPAPRWSRSFDIEPLRRRLAALAPDDPLYPLLLGFLEAMALRLGEAQLDGDAANQMVGRLNMLSDLRSDLQRLWRETHEI